MTRISGPPGLPEPLPAPPQQPVAPAAPIRIGILGAARIAPWALVTPARSNPEVVVTAVAARDPRRADAFARRHRIPRAVASYQALVDDPDLDAVYVPLPAALHGRWTRAALAAGKHVLCEKPFAANADEAAAVAAAAERSGLVVMEAFHYRHHALVTRILELLGEGAIGEITHVRARFHLPLPSRGNIRYDLALGGGALMDAGCYPVHLVRTLARATGDDGAPTVVSARARERGGSGIDEVMTARLSFPGGMSGEISCGMHRLPRGFPTARIIGTRGEIRVRNFVVPQAGCRLTVRAGGKRRRIPVARRPSTYACQLTAFAGAVLRGEPVPTDAADAVASMRVIDACYRAAGLAPREPYPAG
ncbi:Gfo/Idh/MocA family protein [Frankia sp. AgB32]|uniref:Gfo/Idh/MocA family protein n=1 Tax=Frankia sp. AgB32 TaxID=631119 RepID=UPI00200D6602|nr:Gfo/Idh/MocA family oxidoreductase [Frankia sp. AgB32]MCK9896455.1 Gfo/Idh/MocA family oxidoreductase [Frankia sp. AgB32]